LVEKSREYVLDYIFVSMENKGPVVEKLPVHQKEDDKTYYVVARRA